MFLITFKSYLAHILIIFFHIHDSMVVVVVKKGDFFFFLIRKGKLIFKDTNHPKTIKQAKVFLFF